ncbi:PTS sugar transporter subunit IIA [Treponema sp.]|uniref:PTS sugar transporter subunit IIA n=1 Tax=Treponema sp. TaxID=166 RepID=UPI00298D8B56|nr:PTS sugar transporter subunit IIA [Treponema sp.]MCQ2241268.1 PTS sugar transporter subunit IIA [Treponema sp.]
MNFNKIFSPKSVILNLQSEEKDKLFEELVQAIHAANPTLDREEALASVRERESKMTTGIMHSIGVPHGNSKSVKGCVGAVGISQKGIDYASLDGEPVHFVFLLICGEGEDELHLEVLKDLAVLLQDKQFLENLGNSKDPQEVYNLLCRSE